MAANDIVAASSTLAETDEAAPLALDAADRACRSLARVISMPAAPSGTASTLLVVGATSRIREFHQDFLRRSWRSQASLAEYMREQRVIRLALPSGELQSARQRSPSTTTLAARAASSREAQKRDGGCVTLPIVLSQFRADSTRPVIP